VAPIIVSTLGIQGKKLLEAGISSLVTGILTAGKKESLFKLDADSSHEIRQTSSSEDKAAALSAPACEDLDWRRRGGRTRIL
jgi:hypothetical protein